MVGMEEHRSHEGLQGAGMVRTARSVLTPKTHQKVDRRITLHIVMYDTLRLCLRRRENDCSTNGDGS